MRKKPWPKRVKGKRKKNSRPSKEKVFLAVPNIGDERATLGHYIEQEMFFSGHVVVPNRQGGKPTDYCRNLIVQSFMTNEQGRQCDWLYMVDSDTIPPMVGHPKVPEGALARLLSHHHRDPTKKVLAGVTFSVSKGINWMPAMREDNNGLWSPDRRVYKQVTYPLVMVDGIGAACLLIHREVIEAVLSHHGVCFRDHYDGMGRRVLGQDLDFCRKVRERGYTIWCDMQVVCSHWKLVDIKDYTESMLEHINIFRMIARALDSYFGDLETASEKLFGARNSLRGLQEFVDEGRHEDGRIGPAEGAQAGQRDLPDDSVPTEAQVVDVGSDSARPLHPR